MYVCVFMLDWIRLFVCLVVRPSAHLGWPFCISHFDGCSNGNWNMSVNLLQPFLHSKPGIVRGRLAVLNGLMKRSLSESIDRSSPESTHLVLVPRHQVDASRDAWNASSPSPLKRSKNRPGQDPRNIAGEGVGTRETESRMLAMFEEQLKKFEQRKDAEL